MHSSLKKKDMLRFLDKNTINKTDYYIVKSRLQRIGGKMMLRCRNTETKTMVYSLTLG